MKLSHIKNIKESKVKNKENIFKKVFIEKGEIPKLMMFSTATFKPNDYVETHAHNTMFEVFYIKKGKAEFTINNKKYVVRKGNCITIAPGELHSQKNPFTKDVTWLYFGIATDDSLESDVLNRL
jgi:quercetin dioxygenase-like cupin family protein